MAFSSSFYIQLPSNTNVIGNRTCDFIVRLAKKLEFKSEWAVGLAVIIYPHSWPSIGTNEAQFIKIIWKIPNSLINSEYYADWIEKLLPETTQINVPKSKHYKAERLEEALMCLLHEEGMSLAKQLEQTIKQFETTRIRTSLDPNDSSNTLFDEIIRYAKNRMKWLKYLDRKITFDYNKEYQRFKVYFSNFPESDENSNKDNCISHIEVSQQLAYVLGLASTKIFNNNSYASYAPDLLGGISSLYVYAPGLIEPVLIGDTSAPLLRIVHVKKSVDDENVEEIYTAIQYHKLLTKEISEIKIEIRNATGRLIPFEYGNCLITLHFRKLPYF